MPDDKTGFDSATTRTGMRVLVALLALVCGCCPGAQAAMISLHPSKDNSIYSESDNSNARGELFAGVVVSGGLIRRALLQFDLAAGGIPAGSTVNSVTLSLTMTRINPGKTASLFELHPALAAWGQGTSNGTGTGAQPTANDATWYYRQYDADHWATPGGDIGPVSGTATIGTVVATTSYSFASQPGMVANVQNWVNTPGSNFGWMLKAADESATAISARGFYSSEFPAAVQPTLTVDFTPVPEPCTASLLAAAALAVSASRRRVRDGISSR